MSGVISVFSLSSLVACSLTNQQGPDFGLQGKHRCVCIWQMLTYVVQGGLLAEWCSPTPSIQMACEPLEMTGGLNQ